VVPLVVVLVAVVVVEEVVVDEDRSLTKLGLRSNGAKSSNDSSVDDSSFEETTNENRFVVVVVSVESGVPLCSSIAGGDSGFRAMLPASNSLRNERRRERLRRYRQKKIPVVLVSSEQRRCFRCFRTAQRTNQPTGTVLTSAISPVRSNAQRRSPNSESTDDNT